MISFGMRSSSNIRRSIPRTGENWSLNHITRCSLKDGKREFTEKQGIPGLPDHALWVTPSGAGIRSSLRFLGVPNDGKTSNGSLNVTAEWIFKMRNSLAESKFQYKRVVGTARNSLLMSSFSSKIKHTF